MSEDIRFTGTAMHFDNVQRLKKDDVVGVQMEDGSWTLCVLTSYPRVIAVDTGLFEVEFLAREKGEQSEKKFSVTREKPGIWLVDGVGQRAHERIPSPGDFFYVGAHMRSAACQHVTEDHVFDVAGYGWPIEQVSRAVGSNGPAQVTNATEDRATYIVAEALKGAIKMYMHEHHQPETPNGEVTRFVIETAAQVVKELSRVRVESMLKNSSDQKERWYSVDYHGGVELHDSPQEAKESAQYTIDHALDDHWPEGMTRIQWGRLNVVQTCVEKDRREKPKPDSPEAEEWPDNSLDYMCEYVLQDEEL